MTDQQYRKERDSMGEFDVPVEAYYGANTMRAKLNFPISNLKFSRSFIQALGQIKMSAAQTNNELGLLDDNLKDAIVKAAQEVIDGKFDEHFVVDIFQTGSGTSTNMNANEVIANLAIEQLGGVIGSQSPVHPNDHVNIGQSSNDVIPTTIHVSALRAIHDNLIPALQFLQLLLGNEGEPHNYHLTVEIDADFTYTAGAGQWFEIRCTDDAYLFVNGRLVIDLGGYGYNKVMYVDMERLGLLDGESYRVQLFHAQRQRGLGIFRLQTNMVLENRVGVSPAITGVLED